MGTILSVKDINVFYGAIHAITDISFNVDEGEIVTLIGANGAGKSTTLNTISGLLRSKTGDIEFMGSSIAKTSPNKIVGSGLVNSLYKYNLDRCGRGVGINLGSELLNVLFGN